MSVYYQEGSYVCRMRGQELTTSTNGNVQLVLIFRVLGTPDAANPDNYLKAEREYERRLWIVLTEKTLDFSLENLKTLGFTGKSFAALDPKRPGFHSFRDLIVDMYCKHESRPDGTEMERWYIQRPKPAAAAAKEEKLRELDALLAKHVAAK